VKQEQEEACHPGVTLDDELTGDPNDHDAIIYTTTDLRLTPDSTT